MRLVFALLLSFFMTSHALAASEWYQVELFVFAQDKPNTTERWDTNRLPSFTHQAIQLDGQHPRLPNNASDANVAALSGGAWKLADIGLNNPVAAMANRMRANRQYRPLYEARWLQPVFSTANALPIAISGGNFLPALIAEKPKQTSFSDAPNDTTNNTTDEVQYAVIEPNSETDDATQLMSELQGTISLSLSQYVHLSTNLWFASQAEGQPFFAQMNETRRLKNGELHYLDHPLFGLVIRVTRLK